MSRLGKTPILVPKGVEIKGTKEGSLAFNGPKGKLSLQLPQGLHLKFEGAFVVLERNEEPLENFALYGLYRALVQSHIIGVSEGYQIKLAMVGVGYRANVQGDKLDLQVGFSHPTFLVIPKTIQVSVEKGTAILIAGPDKQEVGQFAATVRSMKPPEPYKGKGIRYVDEYVRKKEGKAAKGKTA